MESYTAILHSAWPRNEFRGVLTTSCTNLSFSDKIEGGILRSLYNVWFPEVGGYRVNV